jgi:FKBP-type peptidyl-prolyl cis-trans isomerase FkpA
VRKIIIPITLLLVMLSGQSCLKETTCNSKEPSAEALDMQTFAANAGMTTTAHPSGLLYQIIDPGTGPGPTASSKIAITYTGTLLNGTIFDQRSTPNNTATDPPWALGDLIEGWRIGIPLIGQGGHIKLIVPSSMAYGCTGYGSIPGNSILFFDIHLVQVL